MVEMVNFAFEEVGGHSGVRQGHQLEAKIIYLVMWSKSGPVW